MPKRGIINGENTEHNKERHIEKVEWKRARFSYVVFFYCHEGKKKGVEKKGGEMIQI